MASTFSVDLRGSFREITLAIEEHTQIALSGAALEGTAVANQEAGKYTEFRYVPVGEIAGGFASGVKAENHLMANIWDKGTLGQHKGKLKQPGRRKKSWTVRQRNRTYVAHRHEETLTDPSKGVEGTRWKGKAKAAGTKVLKAEIKKLA